MRRGAIAVSVSVAAHALALYYLLRPERLAHNGSTVGIAIVDTPLRDEPSASSSPVEHQPADHRPIPRARHRRVVRVEVTPSPSSVPTIDPEPAPTGSDAPSVTDDRAPDDVPAPGPSGVVAAPAPSRPRGEARPPGLDRDTCIDRLDYPWKARLLDKEGMVRLRVVLGADGRVQSVTVVQRAGYGFDETAVDAVKTRCHFTPAYDADGRAVPYVIENYHFYFRLDDFDPQAAMRRWQNRWGR